MMQKAIGIDLGTTNTVVAFKDAKVRTLRNKVNEESTRSCVGLNNGEFVVGRIPYKNLKKDPENTILSIKRLMGGTFNDDKIQEKMILDDYYKYKIENYYEGTADALAVKLNGKQYTPEQISAEILKKVTHDASVFLNDNVTHAVITIPAYFTERQRNATLVAAQLAGLKVQKLLSEPTAAAIAYGADNLGPGETKTVLIYDFGGGTFDLSILNIADGEFIEAGSGGDRWLGGDDIDKKLSELIIAKAKEEYPTVNFEEILNKLSDKRRKQYEAEFRFQTEDAKIQLSGANSANIYIDNILFDENGDDIEIDVTIKRSEFENLVRPFVERTILLIDKLLNESSYSIDLIDNILLVGGTSCIPLVKQMLSDRFSSEKVRLQEKPMLAVAEGAAILAHRLDGKFEEGDDLPRPEIGDIISCVTNHEYCIEIVDGKNKQYDTIVEKQMPLPVTTQKIYKTTTNNQKLAKVSIFSKIEDDKLEGQLIGYYLINYNLPIQSELIFEFNLDVDEVFTIKVYSKERPNSIKNIVLAREYADKKALNSIDELIERSITEYKTVDGEDELISYLTSQIKEIDALGSKKGVIDNNKWHEIFYKVTEKYEEIKNNESTSTNLQRLVYRAKRLIIEFGDIIDPFDKESIVNLIRSTEDVDDFEQNLNVENKFQEMISKYGVLNSCLDISPFANRILELPVTNIGKTDKQSDVQQLLELSDNAKSKFISNQVQEAIDLVNKAFNIIDKYNKWL